MIFFFLFVIILLLIALSFVWPPDSPWSPWWRTDKEAARDACRLAGVTKNDVVYELGSGDGEFILTAAREFGAKKAVGIEIDPTRYLISKIRCHPMASPLGEKKQKARSKNAIFIRQDFKKVSLSEATVVYFYLVPNVIKRLMPKLKKELLPGTRIVSYRYKVPLKQLKMDKKNKMYLYKI